ncbi:MAG: hypothetical protein JO362_14260 [Streptomycetaceae bacterium]|nr:hypothetical protein [Streptomycetaceae bacterium]
MTTQAPTTTADIPAQAQPDDEPAAPAPDHDQHGSRTIKVLEAAWEAIRTAHPEVPHVVMITGRGRNPRGMSIKWGHFGADMWTVKGSRKRRVPELFAGGELLALGGRKTIETLLHEAAHGVAHVRKVADTSSDGRYHNKRFVAIAEELGLKGPDRPVSVHGWNDCAITDETAQRYAQVIEALDAAQLPYLHDPLAILLGGGDPTTDAEPTGEDDDQDGDEDEEEAPRKPKKRGNTRFLIICQCTEEGKDGEPQPARRIQISRKSWTAGGEDGGLTCYLVCNSPFEPAEPIDPDDEDEE